MAKPGSIYVAFLRGINVGGKNKLPMRDLVEVFEDAGSSDVVTYIQSGNVVFSADRALAKRMPSLIEARIAKRFGLRVPIVQRSAAELRTVVEENPFSERGLERLHVAFLADRPTAASIATLDPRRSPPDELEVRGREIYLWLPNGVGKTKLSNAYFDSKLATTSTLRNWRTVLELITLTKSVDAGGRATRNQQPSKRPTR